jgi:hypothetical protein
VAKLKMRMSDLTLRDLAEWEPAENITDITLGWNSGPSIEDVLPILKRWRQLRRLTLGKYQNIYVQPFEVLSDFIMALKHLSYLHIAPDYHYSKCGQLEILRDKVNGLILPLRPNFKFDISHFFL